MAYIGKHERSTFWSRKGDRVAFAGFFGTTALAVTGAVVELGRSTQHAVSEYGFFGALINAVQHAESLTPSDTTQSLGTVAIASAVGGVFALGMKRRASTLETPTVFTRPVHEYVEPPLNELHTMALPIVHAAPVAEAAVGRATVHESMSALGQRVPVLVGVNNNY